MKKYRPYTTFPDDIVGKVVITEHGSIMMITAIASGKIMLATLSTYEKDDAFKRLIFTDGTPVGEEYEEKVELEHDKVYLVRYNSGGSWVPRHFCRLDEYGAPLFYFHGMSSKTCIESSPVKAEQVSEYDPYLAGRGGEPNSGYLYKIS